MNGSIRTVPGHSNTPLSGYHYVCPCGWGTHAKDPERIQALAKAHAIDHRNWIRKALGRR